MAVQEQIYRSQGSVSPAAPQPMASEAVFGAGVGAAIEGAGNVLEASSLRALRAKREREQESANADAAVAAAKLSLDLGTMASDKREQAPLDGAGHVEAVTGEADAGVAKFLEGIPDEKVRSRWAARAAEIRGNLIESEDGWARGRRIESIGTNAKEAGRLWDNQLQSHPDPAAFEQSLKAGETFWSGVRAPADVKDKGLREWNAGRASNYLEGLIEKDPVAAKAVIASGTLDLWLDAKDKRRLLDASDSEIRIAAADLRRIHDQAGSQLRQDVTEYKEQVDRGELPSDEVPAALVTRAKALGMTNLVDDLVYTQGKAELSRETDKWTAAEWEQNVNALSAKVAGGKATPAEQVQLRALQELRGPKEARFRNDPRGFAAASGIPLPPEVDLANPDPALVQQQKSWARAMARTGGLVEPPYLNKDQLAAYRARTIQGPVAQLEVTSELRQVWGDAAPSIVRQIGGEPKGDMLVMLGLNDRAAQVYRRGVDALKRPGFKFDDKQAGQLFNAYSAGIPPDLRTPLFNAARAIAAGWMDEQGKNEPTSDFAEVFRQAVHRAGGMIGSSGEGSATGGFVNWNGHYAWLPQDMSRADFQHRIARAAPGDWAKASVDERGNPVNSVPHHYGPDGKPVPYKLGEASRFGQGHFETIAPGIYQLVDPTGGVAVDQHGRPWQFDVRRLPRGHFGGRR